jgi:hypothetical protein
MKVASHCRRRRRLLLVRAIGIGQLATHSRPQLETNFEPFNDVPLKLSLRQLPYLHSFCFFSKVHFLDVTGGLIPCEQVFSAKLRIDLSFFVPFSPFHQTPARVD